MKIIHTADLHLGQVIYQNYSREDEHQHFFEQLTRWCVEEKPDALIVSGDVFDIPQPSAAVKKVFTEYFVGLSMNCPGMHIIITAGNHDSPSRLQADSAVWKLAKVHIVGMAPPSDIEKEGWKDNYIIRLDSGYVIALPFMTNERTEAAQSLLDQVAAENADGKPVIMTGHLAVSDMDPTGHNFDIGTIRTSNVAALGKGYDYLALGHIHKPQTIGHQEDCMNQGPVSYPSGVVRYSGSALHVSCDEQYPHTVSVVEIPRHSADVTLRQLRIDELRHFYVLPAEGSYADEEAALAGIAAFCKTVGQGYIRLNVDYNAPLSPNFSQKVYDMIAPYNDEVRFNPKIIWTGVPEKHEDEEDEQTFEIADIQSMTNPIEFIAKTFDQYPGLDLEEVRVAFREVECEIRRMKEEAALKEKEKSRKNKKTETDNSDE